MRYLVALTGLYVYYMPTTVTFKHCTAEGQYSVKVTDFLPLFGTDVQTKRQSYAGDVPCS